MKKILLLTVIAMCTLITNVNAQSTGIQNFLSGYSHPTDTVTNAASNYVIVNTTNAQTNVSVQPVITKISGTVAGTYYLQGSLDGINYLSIVGDSVTATNVTTNTKIWRETNRNYKYYRVGYTGSGTMSATLRAYLFFQNSNK